MDAHFCVPTPAGCSQTWITVANSVQDGVENTAMNYPSSKRP